ncbi:importin subunit alpha-4 [Lathyrus oleraceus]|uniref:importin subunit alpha-4 n=1 Tax=Pisum sativum TaxID=3888 RepID=UPI0021D32139|nr:importin subunit alpha-4-like [Pisum sativum]
MLAYGSSWQKKLSKPVMTPFQSFFQSEATLVPLNYYAALQFSCLKIFERLAKLEIVWRKGALKTKLFGIEVEQNSFVHSHFETQTWKEHFFKQLQTMSPPRPESEAELKKIEKNERRRKSYKAKREASSYQKIKDEIPEIPGWLMSNQLGKQLEASDKFTMLVEKGEISVIDEVINQGGVPVLVEFLATGDTAELRLIAAQSLANIARGNLVQTQVIIDQNGIPPLVYRLGTGNDEIREMAICALSNISYHSTHTREAVIDSGAFLELWKLLKQPFEPRLTILTKASLALANFCRGEPPNKTVFNQIRQNMPVLKQLLLMTDKQVATNACTTFSLIASKADMIQAVDEAQICARMIELIKKPMPECFEPALLTLAEIAAQNHVSAQRIIGEDLQWLQSFFTDQNNIKIVTQALRLISNLTWTVFQIQV